MPHTHDFTHSGVSRFPDRDLGVTRFHCEVGVPLAESNAKLYIVMAHSTTKS